MEDSPVSERLEEMVTVLRRYWGLWVLFLFLVLLVYLFSKIGPTTLDSPKTWDNIIRLSNDVFQMILTITVVLVSIGAIHVQTHYGEYARAILEDYLEMLKLLITMLLIVVFIMYFINQSELQKSPRVVGGLSILWLAMSVLLVVYIFQKLGELFTISPLTIARRLSQNGKGLAKILKESSGNPWEVFPYLYHLLRLIKISMNDTRTQDQVLSISSEISKSIEYAEYWDPQWWRLHTWVQKDVLGPYLESLFEDRIPSTIIIPLKSASQTDPTLIFGFRELFENFGEILVNNYFFIYPGFEYYIRNLEELAEIDKEYKVIEARIINAALDKLLEFGPSKPEPFYSFEKMKLARSPKGKKVLEEIYANLPEFIENYPTSIPRVLKIALMDLQQNSKDTYSKIEIYKIYKKAINVLIKYPQILTRMFDFELEKLPLGIDVYNVTLAFVKYILKQWENMSDTEADYVAKNLTILFKKTRLFGYSLEIINSKLIIGNEAIELDTREQIEFFKQIMENSKT